MNIRQIRVGARCRFVPYIRLASEDGKVKRADRTPVEGTIVYVNHAHRWFRVEFPAGKGYTLSECIKF